MRNDLPIKCTSDALEIGKYLVMSGMFGVNTAEAGAVIALMCYQEGMSLLEFQRTFHIVSNRPSMKADTMLAKFMENGGEFELLTRSREEASVKMRLKGGKWNTFSLTILQALEAGYPYKKKGSTELSDTWKNLPANMLWARVVSDGVRVTDPRVNAGIYTPEEMEDDSSPKTVPDEPKKTGVDFSKAAEELRSTKASKALSEIIKEPSSDATGLPTGNEIIEIGPHKGKKWKDLDNETLEKILANPPSALTAKDLAAARAALDDIPY